MNFRLHILGSSSSGNCSLLVTPHARILVDAGLSGRRIEQALAKIGESIKDVDAVFITHEHKDHCCGLVGLARFEHLVFFANRETQQAIQASREKMPGNWKIFETGSCFTFRGVTVSAFSIPHDAADPVGYAFSFGAAVPAWTVAWVTDLGYVPQLVREKLRHATHLVLEANYDCGMLDNSGRPPSLKQRIRGRHGHLSNDLALELLMTLENNCLRHVFFGHLSRECNSPELVSDAMMAVRSLRPKCTFTVLDPQADCPVSLEESP